MVGKAGGVPQAYIHNNLWVLVEGVLMDGLISVVMMEGWELREVVEEEEEEALVVVGVEVVRREEEEGSGGD